MAPGEARVVSLEHPPTMPQHSSPLHSPPLVPGSPAITHLLLPTQFRPAHPQGLGTPKLGRPQRGPPHSLARPAATFFFPFFFLSFFTCTFLHTWGGSSRLSKHLPGTATFPPSAPAPPGFLLPLSKAAK